MDLSTFVDSSERSEYERICNQILTALGAARTDPDSCRQRIGERLTRFSGKTYNSPSGAGKVTKEGDAAVKDAMAFLKKQDPIHALGDTLVRGLTLSAQDHCADIGSVGVASHVGSDGSGCWDR